jgi:hypothetical protein
MESLADFLGMPSGPATQAAEPDDNSLESMSGEDFAKAVLRSVEFRRYIINSLHLGSLPSGVVTRLMDMAGWVAPPKRVEHTGKDGAPIETVNIVRRVIVRAGDQHLDEDEAPAAITRH